MLNTLDVRNNITVSGAITGTGGFREIGTGVLTLSGTNTYGGQTWVASSTLKLGSSGALPSGTSLQLGNGGFNDAVLDLNGHSVTVASMTMDMGTLTGAANKSYIIGSTSATGNTTFTCAGSSASTFAGTFQIAK